MAGRLDINPGNAPADLPSATLTNAIMIGFLIEYSQNREPYQSNATFLLHSLVYDSAISPIIERYYEHGNQPSDREEAILRRFHQEFRNNYIPLSRQL